MTGLAALLEDFDSARPAIAPAPVIAEPLDPAPPVADPLASYEDGYRSGWDDATAAAEEGRRKIGEELARNIQEIGFTYFEARNEMLASLDQLLEDVFVKLLPSLRGQSLADNVLQEIREAAAEATDVTIRLQVSEEDAPVLNDILDGSVAFPFEIVPEPAVAVGQAYLDVGGACRRIDVDTVLGRINDTLAALREQVKKDLKHG